MLPGKNFSDNKIKSTACVRDRGAPMRPKLEAAKTEFTWFECQSKSENDSQMKAINLD